MSVRILSIMSEILIILLNGAINRVFQCKFEIINLFFYAVIILHF